MEKEEEAALDKKNYQLENCKTNSLGLHVQVLFVAGEKIVCLGEAVHELNCDDGSVSGMFAVLTPISWVRETPQTQMRSFQRVARRHKLPSFALCAKQNHVEFSLWDKQKSVFSLFAFLEI